jgi:hypothetical protein
VFDRTGIHAWGAVAAAAPFVLALAGVLALQYFQGTYSAPIARYPDEPAHVVTSLMYRQYLLAPTGDPLQFAKDYYSHYPYVGAGHWPPTLHLSAAIWTILTGVGRAQFMLYAALLVAATAALLYRSILTIGSARLAAALVTIWIVLEQSRLAFSRFMTEAPLVCLTLAAVVAYIRYMRTPNYHLALWFAVLSSAAILTKETAIALAVVPPLTVAASRQWHLLRRGHFWLPLAVVLSLAGSWHLWVAGLGVGRFRQGPLQRMSLYSNDTALDRLELLAVLLGWPLLLLAAGGLAATLSRFRKQRELPPFWTAHASLLAGGLIILVLVPESNEARHLHYLSPSLLIFAAAGAWTLTQSVRGSLRAPAAAMLGVCCGLFSPIGFVSKTHAAPYTQDASAIARYLCSRTDARVILVAGGSEGPIIAEAALLEPAPVRYFVRGSKTIYEIDWDDRRQRSLFASESELRDFMDSSGFDAIVYLPGQAEERRPDRAMVQNAIAERPDAWIPVPIDLPGGSKIYRRADAGKTGLRTIRIATSIRLGHDLIIEVPPEPVPPAPAR